MSAPQPWPTGRLCPATSNLPTRMLASTWRTLCAAMQRREAVGARSGGQGQEDFMAISAARFPCATCGGQALPPGLELITQKEGEEMAKQSKIGVCENCGDKGALTGSFGRQVCSTCLKIRSNVNSHLPKIANAARSLHKAEELVGLLVGPEGLRAEVENLALAEIAGIVGYEGDQGEGLVEAVRKRALTCASCDAEDVLHEIREIVGYTDDRGDSRLAEVVRQQLAGQSVLDCTACTNLKGDLLRACELDLDLGTAQDWDCVAAAAIHEMARLQDRRDHWVAKATWYQSGENTANEKLQDALGKLAVANNTICELSAKCDRLEAENTRLREQQPESIGLLDVALAVIREEPVPAGKIASLIDAARRAA